MELFGSLLLLLLITRIFGELAFRHHFPTSLGEVIAGVALGAIAVAYADEVPFFAMLKKDPVFIALTKLGIFFLMLLGGIEFRASDLVESSKRSILVAISGFVVPLVVGFWLSWLFIPDSHYKVVQCLFIGITLSITAVPVSMGVLMEFNQLGTKVGRTIISAAIIDDVLSLVMLAFLTGLIKTGQAPDVLSFIKLLGEVSCFFLIAFIVAWLVVPYVARFVSQVKTAEFEFASLLLAGLTFSVIAEALHLHYILGAFVAGLLFEGRITGQKIYANVKDRVSALSTGIFAPIFYASIGMNLDFKAAMNTPVFLILLIFMAFFTKLVGAGLPAFLMGLNKREALAVGVGMGARGAVELVVADTALKGGVFSHPDPTPLIVENLFSAVVTVALVTKIITPLILREVFKTK